MTDDITTAPASGFGVLKLERRRRIDWPRLLANVRQCEHPDGGRWTMEQIAEHAQIGKATLYAYDRQDPSEPAFWVGVRLCELWGRVTGYRMGALPTRRADPSVAEMMRGFGE